MSLRVRLPSTAYSARPGFASHIRSASTTALQGKDLIFTGKAFRRDKPS